MQYVFAFRGPVGRRPTAEQLARWPAWFEDIKDSIADRGNQVGRVREVGGDGPRADELGGYIVVNAESLDAAAALAGGCPILQQGGSVEVGEFVSA
jgi:hypothetical protein